MIHAYMMIWWYMLLWWYKMIWWYMIIWWYKMIWWYMLTWWYKMIWWYMLIWWYKMIWWYMLIWWWRMVPSGLVMLSPEKWRKSYNPQIVTHNHQNHNPVQCIEVHRQHQHHYQCIVQWGSSHIPGPKGQACSPPPWNMWCSLMPWTVTHSNALKSV